MSRRQFLRAGSAAAVASAVSAMGTAAQTQAVPLPRVFRWALVGAETGFDPAQISDLYSNYVVSNIFEAPLQYDHLARPALIKPRTAAVMPEISDDFRTITVRIRSGIFFADDPAFKGERRELTAADYVYQCKRLADPRWESPLWPSIESAQILGLAEARRAALANGRFDYDRPLEGLHALDRYTFRIRLAEPGPRFYENLTDARLFGAVAREIVEAYPDEIMGRPVGTGPYRLATWVRASRIVLERNPGFREEFYDAQPAPDDERGLRTLRQLRGRKLPMIDRVELAVINESQPRWLAFLNGQHDTVNVPLEFVNVAAPNGRVAPALARRGIELERVINPDIVVTYYNMDDPVVGGYEPPQVALRRALALGYDTGEEIRLVRNGAMLVAQSHVPPLTFGYDPRFVSEMGEFSRQRARALLDTYGYLDRDGDGWRERPDGNLLEIEFTSQSSALDRALNELRQRHASALGIRTRFRVGQFPENSKNARAGKLMIWSLGWSATGSDPDSFLALGLSRNIGGSNLARFTRKAYDQLYDRQRQLPDGAEREAVIREMKRMFVAWMPYKVLGHRFVNDVSHPWLTGYRRHPFARDFFKYIDVDPELQAAGSV